MAATQTVAKGGQLAELAASLAISINTVARQQQEIKRLYEHINDMIQNWFCTLSAEVTTTYRSTQKEFMLLRHKKDDGQKGVGWKIDGQEGSGIQL